MDEIIYLEPDEEITSVIDKIKALPKEAKKISLVVPKGATILQSVVNLKLLKKEGHILEKDLGLVTQDRIGRNLASQAGFSVYSSIDSKKPVTDATKPMPKVDDVIDLDFTDKKEDDEEEVEKTDGVKVNRYDESVQEENKEPIENKVEVAEEESDDEREADDEPEDVEKETNNHEDDKSINEDTVEDKPEEKKETIAENKNNIAPKTLSELRAEKPKRKRPVFIILAIIFVVLGVGAIIYALKGNIFYVYYPKATVNMVLKSEPFSEKVDINIDNNAEKNDPTKSTIKGDLIESEQTGEKKVNATGTKDAGEKAHGTVTISNDSGDVQKVNAGTEVKSESGFSYKTSEAVNIPGATASVDSHGNVVKTAGKSDVAVESSDPGDKYNIGPTTFTVTGKSMLTAKSTSPMSGGLTKQLTVVSQTDINNAKSTLSEEVYKKAHEDLKTKAGANKIFESAIADEIITAETDKKAGDETKEFTLKLKVKSSTISFVEEDFRQMVISVLQNKIPEGKELALSSTDQIVTGNTTINTKEGVLKVSGDIKTNLIAKIDNSKLINSIMGKKQSDAENIIKENKDIVSVDFEFNPTWWIKILPSKADNISITKVAK